ncbi:MAG: LysM peptidoglycan-binding domain-containing protein [Deltaproteobacteria bacterium]|nr:LysM peptidoglycan-binding domain-containing protein [Deltaproteobacteria bacterium]
MRQKLIDLTIKFRKINLAIISAVILTAMVGWLPGCTGVSEEDIQKLREENQTLAVQLEMEKKEAEILNRALTNVYRERDRLVDLLSGPPPKLEEDTVAESETGSEANRRVHVVKVGETLSVIASRYRTTVPILLDLNPFLMSRNNYMVWVNDRLALPAN